MCLISVANDKSKKRKEKFKHYKDSIEKIISKVALRLGVENVLYSYRTVEELNDFAYNLPENDKAKDFDKKTYKNNFDKLDLVFIDGYEKDYLPWQTKLYRLIKLCETFQKIILAQGIGMIHLIYYLATNGMEKNIINSSEEYPTIESLDIIPKEFLSNLKVEDIFLDFATGDIFHFNGSDKWEPVGNIGIHKLQYAEKYSNRGKFVLKPFHRSHKEELISITRNDVKVKIGKQVVLHWFLKNLSDEFVAYTSLNWFLHNICVNSKKLQYKVLADSNLGPMILEHQNSIGTIFHLDKDNKETLIMFENFVERSFKEIQKNVWFNRNKRKEDLSSAIFKDYGKNLNYDETQEEVKKLEKLRSFTPMTIVNRSKLYRNIVTKEFEGNHCGCSYNPTEMIFVKNNSVLKQKYPVKKKNVITESYSKEKLKILTEKIMRDDFDYLKPKREAIDELAIEYYKKKQREICEKLDGEKILMESAVNKLTKRCNVSINRQIYG
ncbi:MAG: hypothetical protein MJ252_04420, partial [archaeon]|nr:hypothetical protein [archaeon]